MVRIVSDESSVGRSMEGLSSDALAEWRSSEQVENGIPSTSPPYWDIDDSDDDGGLKPSELYGRHNWKIENISQINKRELRSNAFEVGGYKWYILIYPQGCDVCNHLSLFLCVANHDKLLPGWSHFAQFTIAVVNKDPKKSKFSDTLHRFWKKEHDWGWKKFMELSKVSDGFVDGDALTIKAQVQVIREKVDRPFRCLDRHYRRELVRVYLTNVEQICRRFVEERRGKLGKLIEDKAKWSSFCAFWLGMDQNVRRRMSKEKKDVVFKVAVKHFFVEKEVTSTLVMDSLYSGLKALEGQSKGKKGKGKLLEGEDTTPAPIVRVEKDMFVLVDDVLLLLERASMEPLPPKDEKGPQNCTKDGGSGEDFYKASIERDERRLTELGRRTVEIFVLAHIFSSKIEAAYQEAVSLKRQEELILEEEAAWQVESEQKAKRGAEKDKKSKKKQSKQKRNNRRRKEKTKDDKPLVSGQDKHENLIAHEKDLVVSQTMLAKHDELEDLSDASDSVECIIDVLHPDSEDRDTSPVNWDTDTSEAQPSEEGSGSGISVISTVVQNGVYKRSSSLMDDSSSTCSTDSAPSVTITGSYRTNSTANYNRCQKSLTKGGSQPTKGSERYNGANEADNAALLYGTCPSHKAVKLNVSEGVVTSLQDRTKWPELNASKKEEVLLLQRKASIKAHVDKGSSLKKTTIITPHSAKSPPKKVTSTPAAQPKPELKNTVNGALVPAKKALVNGQQLATDKTTTANASQPATIASRPDSTKASVPRLSEKVTGQQAVVFSSAPLTPATLPQATTPAVSVVQTSASSIPSLPCSVITDGRLGSEPSPGAQDYTPQTYRNAITGNSLSVSSAGFMHSPQQMGLVPTSAFLPQPWIKSPQRDISTSSMFESSSNSSGIPSFDLYRHMNNNVAHEILPGRQVQCAMADEFPHLDIINDLLLDDEQSIESSVVHGVGNRQFTNMNLQSHYNSVRDFTPSSQVNSMDYMNSQIDSVPNQWQQNHDLSFLGIRSSAMEGYPYNVSDYLNMTRGVNGYGIFRPSNDH